jgi:hypothetical protein
MGALWEESSLYLSYLFPYRSKQQLEIQAHALGGVQCKTLCYTRLLFRVTFPRRSVIVLHDRLNCPDVMLRVRVGVKAKSHIHPSTQPTTTFITV